MPKCPGCGRSYGQPPLNTRCDTCGAAFCYNGNCEGTLPNLSQRKTQEIIMQRFCKPVLTATLSQMTIGSFS
jgi:hypothetical protein